MVEKAIQKIKSNPISFFGIIVTTVGVLMLFGAWYYSSKNLPDRVTCLERDMEVTKTAITKDVGYLAKDVGYLKEQSAKTEVKQDAMNRKLDMIIMRLPATKGLDRVGDNE